jgi:DNA-binding transcriptional regulator YhcF (GntR family)
MLAGGVSSVASHRIAGSLRTAILDGSYLPGERIRQEDVAARSGASRIPVREALRMLDAEGLVTLVANSGAWVTELTLDECAETYMIRERLEPLLLRRSMPRLDAAAMDRLGRLAGDMETRARPGRSFTGCGTRPSITGASSRGARLVRRGSRDWPSRTWSTACCSTASAGKTRTTRSACSSPTSGAPAWSW